MEGLVMVDFGVEIVPNYEGVKMDKCSGG